MRNLNIKKLVAVAAGAVLVGSALAPIVSAISLTKSDLVSGTGVNVDVIVGKKASVSDGVWAGNIAVAIGQQAYSEKEVLVGDADCSGGATPSVTGLSVDLTVGGTTTVTGGKTFYDDMYSGNNGGQEQNFNSKFVTNDSVPSLYYNGSKSYTWNGTGYTTSIQERLYFTVDVKFDDTVNNALVAEITQGNLKYNLNLGSGIPRYEGLSGTDNFTDDGNDNVRIPFFGTDYLVKNVTTTYVELLQTSGETQYSEGDRITDLEGYDGGMYYLEIGRGGIVSSAEKIILSLYKEDGTLVKTASFGTGDVVFYGDYGDYAGEPVISTLVNISEILKTVQSDAEVYTPTIFVGSARILLYNEKGYPYDTTLPEDDYDWKVNLNFDGNYLKDINIQNKTKYDFVALDALKIGEKANFPGELGTIEFLGLQLPEFTGVSKNERTTVIEIKDGKMLYKDSTYEAAHEVPMYYYSGLTISDEGTDTVTIDSKVQWFKLSLDDINVLSNTSADGSGTDYGCIGDGNYINGEKVFVNDVNQQGGIKQVAINNIGVTSAAADYNVGERVDINGMNFLVSGLSNDSNCEIGRPHV